MSALPLPLELRRNCLLCGEPFYLRLLPNTSDTARDDFAGEHCTQIQRLRYYFGKEVFHGTEREMCIWFREKLPTAKNLYETGMYRPVYVYMVAPMLRYSESMA